MEGIDDPSQISGERKLLQLLQPANEVWGKVMFSRVFVCPRGEGGYFPSMHNRSHDQGGGGLHPGGGGSASRGSGFCI